MLEDSPFQVSEPSNGLACIIKQQFGLLLHFGPFLLHINFLQRKLRHRHNGTAKQESKAQKKKTLIPSFMHWSVKPDFACYQSWKCSKSFMHWSQIRLFAKSGDVPERNTHTYWSQYPSHLASEQHLQVSELP